MAKIIGRGAGGNGSWFSGSENSRFENPFGLVVTPRLEIHLFFEQIMCCWNQRSHAEQRRFRPGSNKRSSSLPSNFAEPNTPKLRLTSCQKYR
jgi:hypothetical protein